MKTILLIIDPQIDFHPEYNHENSQFSHISGSLPVDGANDDMERIVKLISDNTNTIDEIYVTLDSHHRNHIAHSVFWTNSNNKSPEPFTQITYEDVLNNTWTPRDISLRDHALLYTQQLGINQKYELTIWPEHCLIGSIGHAIVPLLFNALQGWCLYNNKSIHFIHKGMNCLTEMYSAISADVIIPTDTNTHRNTQLIDELKSSDKLVICGQALSHCVAFTLSDLLEDWDSKNYSRVHLLIDGSSPVKGFEAKAKDFIEKISNLGVSISSTTTVFNR